MKFYCHNGEMVHSPTFITPQNRSFRYGDGVFETMKIFKNEIMLREFHFERLFTSLVLLKISGTEYTTKERLNTDVLQVCNLNNCKDSAKVRIAVYRENENKAGVIIEADPLDKKTNSLNEEGWSIDIYPSVRKSMDAFANLKSANYLPYVLADLHAKENGNDECLVLNCNNKISDASKANIFLLLNDEVYTPALHQGCVNGVKRRFLIEQLKRAGMPVHQHEISEEHLIEAQEVFLTNAINDIRWVKSFRNKTYRNFWVKEFYKKAIATIYS
jgi:branched-chain amino acid aminotransferase